MIPALHKPGNDECITSGERMVLSKYLAYLAEGNRFAAGKLEKMCGRPHLI